MNLAEFSFVKDGFESMTQVFSKHDCTQLLSKAMSSRDFKNIFMSESDYRKNPKQIGNAPRPGRNLLAKLDTEFIFSNSNFLQTMTRLLGPRWRVLDYKFVVGLEDEAIPDWISEELADRPVANVGAYVKEAFRDMTYFRGIDFHQDIIDFPDREADFITVYIYLDDVDESSAPLVIIPRSHQFGATIFPHNLKQKSDGSYIYQDDLGKQMTLSSVSLTGQVGTMYFWHSAILHGTQPTIGNERRISVRILVEKNSRSLKSCELDEVNSEIRGPLALGMTRRDLDDQGNSVLRQNIINSSKN